MSRGSCGEMMRDGSLRSLFEDYAHPPPPPSPPFLLLPSGEVGAARYSTNCLPELHLPALGLVRGRIDSWCLSLCVKRFNCSQR